MVVGSMAVVPQYLWTSLWQSLVNLGEVSNIYAPQLSLTPFLPPLQLPHPECLQALSTQLPFQLSDPPLSLHLPVPKFIHVDLCLPPASSQSLFHNTTVVYFPEQKQLMMSLPGIKVFKFNSVFFSQLWLHLTSSPTPLLYSLMLHPLRIPNELCYFLLGLCLICSVCLKCCLSIPFQSLPRKFLHIFQDSVQTSLLLLKPSLMFLCKMNVISNTSVIIHSTLQPYFTYLSPEVDGDSREYKLFLIKKIVFYSPEYLAQ